MYDVVTLKPVMATDKNRIRNLKVIAEHAQIKWVLEKYESSEKIENSSEMITSTVIK